jgi:hypothetical protein
VEHPNAKDDMVRNLQAMDSWIEQTADGRTMKDRVRDGHDWSNGAGSLLHTEFNVTPKKLDGKFDPFGHSSTQSHGLDESNGLTSVVFRFDAHDEYQTRLENNNLNLSGILEKGKFLVPNLRALRINSPKGFHLASEYQRRYRIVQYANVLQTELTF